MDVLKSIVKDQQDALNILESTTLKFAENEKTRKLSVLYCGVAYSANYRVYSTALALQEMRNKATNKILIEN